jgi:hypothetical protein
MSIPDFQSIMLPLMEIAADKDSQEDYLCWEKIMVKLI